MWEMTDIRGRAIDRLLQDTEDPLEQVQLGRKYGSESLVRTGLSTLITCETAISDEIAQNPAIGWPMALKLSRLREEYIKSQQWDYMDVDARLKEEFGEDLDG